jgi:3-oxoacyl-[acyl-carrier protein] reductase
MENLLGKKALVTGGSRGIGAAIARKLAEQGADVAITFENSIQAAQQIVREIEAMGRHGLSIAANSADVNEVQRSIATTVARLGGLDILVNNAGIGHVGSLETVSLAEMQRVLDVNLRSVLVASRAAITHLSAGGRIINIGSNLADRVPFAGVTLYAMTKSALTGLTKGLARDLGPRDITVNIVHPGPTDTDMNPAAGPNGDFLRAAIPLGRFGSTHDVAAMVAFLASPEARHVTGACFAVDGGINA